MSYKDGEVINLDKDDCVVLWDADKQQPYNCGETLEQYGFDNLTDEEKTRLNTTEGKCEACCHTVSYWLQGDAPINEDLKREMAEHAEERAKDCIINGVPQGELNFIDNGTQNEYTGWWKIERD